MSGKLGSFPDLRREETKVFFLAACTQPRTFNNCFQPSELSNASALALRVAFASEDNEWH